MISTSVSHNCTSPYSFAADDTAGVHYLSKEQIVGTMRLASGDRIFAVRRETYGEFETNDEPGGWNCAVSPHREVWIVRVRFTHPEWFVSAEYARGVATTVIDAQTGEHLGLAVRGTFLSGPFGRKPSPKPM